MHTIIHRIPITIMTIPTYHLHLSISDNHHLYRDPSFYFFSQQHLTNNVSIYYTFLVTMTTPAPSPVQNSHIPHSISHVDTHKTAALQTYLSPDTRPSLVHKFMITPLYIRRVVQELKHEHTIYLR